MENAELAFKCGKKENNLKIKLFVNDNITIFIIFLHPSCGKNVTSMHKF